MSQRPYLKTLFETNDKPTQLDFEDLIDSTVNVEEDKASVTDAENGNDISKYINPAAAKASVLKWAPVKKVNGINPDASGEITITSIASAGTISGNIAKSQVVGLQGDLDSKQATLVSGTNIRTINGQSLIGGGSDLVVGGSGRIIAMPNAAYSLSNSATAQNAFPSTCDVITLEANKTYFFRGKFLIANGTTAHATKIGWALSGMTVQISYVAKSFTSAASNSGNSATFTEINVATAVALTASTNTAILTNIEFDGILRTTGTSGTPTITPQITFSVAPGGTNTMKVGSFVEFVEVGNNTIETVGTVG